MEDELESTELPGEPESAELPGKPITEELQTQDEPRATEPAAAMVAVGCADPTEGGSLLPQQWGPAATALLPGSMLRGGDPLTPATGVASSPGGYGCNLSYHANVGGQALPQAA